MKKIQYIIINNSINVCTSTQHHNNQVKNMCKKQRWFVNEISENIFIIVTCCKYYVKYVLKKN